jgi:hypothetical protein
MPVVVSRDVAVAPASEVDVAVGDSGADVFAAWHEFAARVSARCGEDEHDSYSSAIPFATRRLLHASGVYRVTLSISIPAQATAHGRPHHQHTIRRERTPLDTTGCLLINATGRHYAVALRFNFAITA